MLKYELPVGGEVFFLRKEMHDEVIRSDQGGNEAKRPNITRRCRNASKDYDEMQRLQAEKLQYLQEQKEHARTS